MNKDKRKKLKQFFSFGVVGGFGTVVNTALLYGLTVFIGIYYLFSSVIATEIAIISNFVGNHFLTFRDRKDPSPLKEKFVKFQLISVTTIIGTVAILWFLVTFFGQDRLIIWNLIAILAMFAANFALNSKITWKENHQENVSQNKSSKRKKPFFILAFVTLVLISGPVTAQLLSASHMGYHPESEKQIVVYTGSSGGQFTIFKGSKEVFNGNLVKAKDYSGSNVECQGENSCLIGVFTELEEEGEYRVRTSLTSSQEIRFSIDDNIYKENIPVLLEFFDAQRQQGSSYHSDYHSGYSPGFSTIADGSFIMESHQASKTLIRLSSAYNRNPSIFDEEMHDTIKVYVEYLKGLQGLEIKETEFGHPGYESGFRLIPDMKVNNLFVPGPVPSWMGSSMDIYNPDETLSQADVPIISLCGEDDGTSEWRECIDHAAKYYKCQIDEPCLNATYIENTGKVKSRFNGYGVARGWSTEFGCYFDVTLKKEMFTGGDMNPCLVFYPEETRGNTVETLYGFTMAIPALHDEDPEYAKGLFEHSLLTYGYIKSTYPSFKADDPDAGFFGAALFKLYDYTGEESYLMEAHSLRNKVTPSITSVFISDSTRGSEFYWEEYARHKEDIQKSGLQYAYQGKTPEEMLDDKIYFDWKDRGELSVSSNGERVFQFDPGIKFQNSRYILTESLIASKTMDLHSSEQPFVSTVADSQIAWMTGMNGIPEGISPSSPLTSYSFIFGIGEEVNPEQFHSRYLVNTGFREDTNGEVVGVRGTAKKFHDGSQYVFLDGKISVLGKDLGAIGNGYRSEPQTQLWKIGQTFANGKRYISGWINGAFPIPEDNPDRVFNYVDTVHTYEFTETTDEIVSTAIELFSYQDAIKNGRPMHPGVTFNDTSGGQTNASLAVTSLPQGADIFIDGALQEEKTPADFSLAPGTYNITVNLEGYHPETEIIQLSESESRILHFDLEEIIIPQNATLILTSDPDEALAKIDGIIQGLTPLERSIVPGEYEIEISKPGFITNTSTVDLPEGETFWHVILEPVPVVINNGTLIVNSNPSQARVFIDGEPSGLTPFSKSLEPGEYEVEVRKEGYLSNSTSVMIIEDEVTAINLTLTEIPSGTLNGTLIVNSNPTEAEVFVNGELIGSTPIEKSLIPGEYDLRISKEGYLEQETTAVINENETTIINVTLEQIPSGTINGTLEVYSIPSDANVFIDGELAGSTPLIKSLVPGEYDVEVSKEGYLSNETTAIITENKTTIINLTLEQVPSGGVSIIDHGIDMQGETNSSTGADYRIYESETGKMFVELDDAGEVIWRIDDEIIQTTQGTHHEINWTPGILLTDRLEDVMINASVGNESVSWHVDVHNFLNPFFSPSAGRAGSEINVFTNDLKARFDNISVYIEGSDGTKKYPLESFPAENNETSWKRPISDGEFSFGNNYLVEIEVHQGGAMTNHSLPTEGSQIRAFHKPSPSGGSSPGGSGPSSGPEEIEMIYVILEKDVIGINESQRITLDARSTRQVRSVEAVFLIRDGGFLTQELNITDGDRTYGTWSSSFRVPTYGLYELQQINIIGATKNYTSNITDRTFYVIGDAVGEDEELVLIYTALDESVVIEATNVTLRLDARDYLGVEEIYAEVTAKRGDESRNFTVPLALMQGDSNYGTWEGTIEVNSSDTTYNVERIILSNEKLVKIYLIEGRSIYATNDIPDPNPQESGAGFITGAAIFPLIDDPLSHPLFPIIVGVVLLIILLGGAALKSKAENYVKRRKGEA